MLTNYLQDINKYSVHTQPKYYYYGRLMNSDSTSLENAITKNNIIQAGMLG